MLSFRNLLPAFTVIIITTTLPLNAQELLVIFASNLETTGGVNGNDNSGADLYSVRFNPATKTVVDLQRLTATSTEVEFFPSLSPDRKWVAYNYQRGSRNEIRLIHLATNTPTNIFTGGRFPEWVATNELLVTYASRDTQDVFLLKLDLSGAAPKVLSRQQITDRTRCAGTSIGSDAYPFANGSKLVFHVLRPNRQEGAAMAMINADGSEYRRLTDWNGSGHGVVTADGRFVASSNSQTGKAVLLEVKTDTVLFSYLPLSPFGRDLSVYDNRYANVPVCSYAYQAWGANERSLFHSVTGNNTNLGVALTRLLYTTFDAEWKNPQVVDFSTAVEKLAGKTGRDFSTASARLISATPPATGVVYVTLAMHNEDNFPATQQVYLTSRNNLIEFGKMLQRNNVPFNWESDWRFLNGVFQWDTPAVTASTNGKNIVRYLKEDLGISIDPHSHENQGYNYADVAHLIDSLGVQPTKVVGGHIWDPNETLYQNWERFKQPLKGSKFPWSQWKGDILMGSATGLHRNDPEPTGVWRPKGKYDFWSDDPASTVHGIGQHQGSVAGIQALIDLYKTGAVTPDKILTATIVIGQATLNSQNIANYENTTLKPLLEMQNRSEIKIVTFGQLLDEWKAKYNSVPHLRLGTTTEVNENAGGVSSPVVFSLAQNYPNPFNPATTIRFTLARREQVVLKILDSLGREVATLIDGAVDGGEHAVVFAASKLASGTYYYHLKTETSDASKAMQLLK